MKLEQVQELIGRSVIYRSSPGTSSISVGKIIAIHGEGAEARIELHVVLEPAPGASRLTTKSMATPKQILCLLKSKDVSFHEAELVLSTRRERGAEHARVTPGVWLDGVWTQLMDGIVHLKRVVDGRLEMVVENGAPPYFMKLTFSGLESPALVEELVGDDVLTQVDAPSVLINLLNETAPRMLEDGALEPETVKFNGPFHWKALNEEEQRAILPY